MRTTTTGKHHLQTFTSLREFTDYSRSIPDHRSDSIRSGDADYYGTAAGHDLPHLHGLSDQGMAREGIAAVKLAEEKLRGLDREIVDQDWQMTFDVCGADVDVPRYLDGEPENMRDFTYVGSPVIRPIITLVVNVAVHCGITTESFIKHGSALVAVAEAIDRSGLQSEIYADFTVRGSESRGRGGVHTGRFAVRLKAGDGPFDSGAFMFTLTHPAMFRGMVLNAMHQWPLAWRENMSVGGFYGWPVSDFRHPEDYPADCVYIPAMQDNRDAGNFVEDVLTKLDLI